MPLNEADQKKYAVIRDRYSSDMSDADFALITPLLRAPKRRGRKPRDFRVVIVSLSIGNDGMSKVDRDHCFLDLGQRRLISFCHAIFEDKWFWETTVQRGPCILEKTPRLRLRQLAGRRTLGQS